MQILKALAGGMVIGIIMLEAVIAGAQALVAGTALNMPAQSAGTDPGIGAVIVLLTAWLVAGLFAAMMAAAMASNRAAGWLAGGLLCIPAFVTPLLSGLGGVALIVTGLTLAAAITGAGIARRISVADMS